METWFLLTLGSAILSGFHVYTSKVAAERNYDAALVNTYAAVISASLLFGVAVYLSDSFYLNHYILGLLAVSAVMYMGANLTRHQALQAIDTAIFFPVYKVIGPLFVIGLGVFTFGERFTMIEWIGLALSLLVPLLLISKAENLRQKDLKRGLKFLFATTIMSAIAAILGKEMAVSTDNIWFLIAVGDVMLAAVGIVILKYKNRNLIERVKEHTNRQILALALWMGGLQAIAFSMIMFAYTTGPVGVIYTINSLYILIPIILSIIFYNEHWNARKVIAIILSVAALALLQ